jgi:hypothetical protein
MNSFFIERLTYKSIKIFLYIFIIKLFKKTYNVIYFIDGNKRTEKLFKVFSSLFGFKLKKMSFDFNDIKNSENELLGIKVENFELSRLNEKIISSSTFKGLVKKYSIKSYKKFYLEKSFINNFDEDNSLKRLLFIKYVAIWKLRLKNNYNIIFYMKYRPWSREIEKFVNQNNFKIKWDKKLISFDFKGLSRIIENSLILIRNLFISSNKVSSNNYKSIKENEPKICVPYWGNMNLENPKLQSDFFFVDQKNLKFKDILILFSRHYNQKERNTNLNKNKIKTVHLGNSSTINELLINYLFKKIINLFSSSYFRMTFRSFKRNSNEFDDKVLFWKSFFLKHKIKIHISWYKHDASHVAISSALNSIGGVSAIYQRSYEGSPNITLRNYNDIYFSYSNYHSIIERKNRSIIPYHVSVGFLGDHRFNLLKNTANKIRHQLNQNKAEFIISYFDENSIDDGRWWNNHKKIKDDYEFLIEKVLRNQNLGVIFKPKKSSDLRQRLGSSVNTLDKAIQTGRCIILESTGILKNHYPPAIGALASDVAIGNKFAGTAALEASLSGTPTLLIDKFGWTDNKLDLLGNDIIFKDWESLWNYCNNYISSKFKIDNFGDWSNLIDELDPFHDGKAAERMGTYLFWLKNEFEKNSSKKEVLNLVANKYIDKWGYDKIQRVNS